MVRGDRERVPGSETEARGGSEEKARRHATRPVLAGADELYIDADPRIWRKDPKSVAYSDPFVL